MYKAISNFIPMRFHALGLQHTVTSSEYNACAYTQKVVKFCKMMVKRGHTVIHYGHEKSDVKCSEHVTVVSADLHTKVYNHNWRKEFFKFDASDEVHQTFNKNAIQEIQKRKQPGDFLLAFWGYGHYDICMACPDLICVEPGIGYASTASFCQWRIYESYALLHASTPDLSKTSWYHAVIPNYFDPDEFEYEPDKKEDYFLYMGRILEEKGVGIAIDVTHRLGVKLVVAGQGGPENLQMPGWPEHVTYVGYADVPVRKRLMARAKAAFVLTQYVEPFGGVSIEHLMSGTPIITTDWGAFAENNIHGVTGYRCRTFDHIMWAAQNIGKISPKACRDWAMDNFSLEKITSMYEEYFQMVQDVHSGKGWYQLHPERKNLDWLTRKYPQPQEDPVDNPFTFAEA
jgi:glycosyltransferase involved in cell wall biosynthesis